jgi:drug/metabolite transporter (DMT)-like permease
VRERITGVSFGRGVFTIVMLTLIWGTSFAVTKDVLSVLPVALLAALRSVLSLVSLLWVKPDRRSIIPGLWLGLIAVGGFVFQMIGLTSTTASKSAFIIALNSLVAPLVSAWFFKHFVPRRAYGATFIALIGLALMTLTGQSSVNPGDVWSFVGALFFGVYIAYVSEIANKTSVLVVTQMQYLVMAIVTVIWAWPHVHLIPTLSSEVWLVVLYLGVMCMSVPTVLQVWAQRVVPPYLAALLFILEPVFASFFAFMLLNEKMSTLDWLGATLVIASLLVCALPVRAKPAPLVVENKTTF